MAAPHGPRLGLLSDEERLFLQQGKGAVANPSRVRGRLRHKSSRLSREVEAFVSDVGLLGRSLEFAQPELNDEGLRDPSFQQEIEPIQWGQPRALRPFVKSRPLVLTLVETMDQIKMEGGDPWREVAMLRVAFRNLQFRTEGYKWRSEAEERDLVLLGEILELVRDGFRDGERDLKSLEGWFSRHGTAERTYRVMCRNFWKLSEADAEHSESSEDLATNARLTRRECNRSLRDLEGKGLVKSEHSRWFLTEKGKAMATLDWLDSHLSSDPPDSNPSKRLRPSA